MNSPEKKLAILSLQYHCYPDAVGGAWGLTYEVNKRFVTKGHRVYLITCDPKGSLPAQELVDGIYFYRTSLRASKSFFSLWRSIRSCINAILKSEKIDLVHIHNPLIGFLAILNSQLWKIPKVYHFHSSWYDEEKINELGVEQHNIPWKLRIKLLLIQIIEGIGYGVSQTIFFLSDYSKSRFLEYYRCTSPKLCVIPGGVDVTEFQPAKSRQEMESIRVDLKLSAKVPLIFTARRLEQRMGLENLILAAGNLHRDNPELEFLILITGKGRLRERLEKLIEEQEVSNRVQLKGLVPRETLSQYFCCVDLFVLPTTAIEGFGLVTAEAFASGLPVMGTPVGATIEILRQVDDMLLFKDTSPEALATGLKTFLDNPQSFNEMRTQCRNIAETKYSWETVVTKIEKELLEVVKWG